MRNLYLPVVAIVMIACVVLGCAHRDGAAAAGSTAESSSSHGGPLAALFGPARDKPGAQLWAENCTRCHYVRPPTYYSSQQWELVMQHMRSRANLTGVEERKILEFLKSGAGVEG